MSKAAVKGGDMEVSFEDQKKINQFAKLSYQSTEIEDELMEKKKYMENIDDAVMELMMSEDDDIIVPVKFGSVFVHHSSDDTNELLEKMKETTVEECSKLESELGELKSSMSLLKAELYGKFGNNINLDRDD